MQPFFWRGHVPAENREEVKTGLADGQLAVCSRGQGRVKRVEQLQEKLWGLFGGD